jgi:hypothetical protein
LDQHEKLGCADVLPLAASLVDDDIFVALVEGFAALGTVVTTYSAFLAFFALLLGDSNEKIGEAVNYGIAFGFVPGIMVGGAIFYSSVTTL